MKWPQRWMAAFVVTLPADKGKGKGSIQSNGLFVRLTTYRYC